MAGFISFALASDPDQSTNVQRGYTNVLGTPVTPQDFPSISGIQPQLSQERRVLNEISPDERPGSQHRTVGARRAPTS